jgi:hypothetical protein
MNKIIFFIICFISTTCFAFAPAADKAATLAALSSCPQAVPTTDGGFCPSFKAVATCHCVESGMPVKACQNMDLLYAAMIGRYTTVERACANQHDTSTQNCIDDWKCYRSGGSTAGGLCSSTGSKCE